MRKPDTYRPTGKRWDDALGSRNPQAVRHIEEWNIAKGKASRNHYTHSEIHAYAIIKTLPACDPGLVSEECTGE